MKSLWKYLRRYRLQCVLAPLFKMLEASFELIIPLVVASIVDVGIGGGDSGHVVRMVMIMVALGLIGLVCSVTAQYFSAKAATGTASAIRAALFRRLETLSFSNIDTVGTSAMITRMTSDVNQTQNGINLTLRLFLRSPFVVFGAMVMAFTIDWRCALIFVAVIAALSVVVFGIMALNIPMVRGVQKALEQVLGATRENLNGARVIRAFCKEDDEFAAFVEKNRELTKRQKKAGWVSGLLNPLTYLLINGAVVWLIYKGAVRVSVGSLSQGQVVALYNYMSQILVELIKLANLIVSINKALASWNRIADALAIKNDMTSPEKSAPEADRDIAVRFEHVSLTYKNAGGESLTDIDLTARRGETIGIIGGTGSGKTSVVNLIARFYDATSGRVLVNGTDVRDYNEGDLRRRIGFVPQTAMLFKGTIRDNLRWGAPHASEGELIDAIRLAQAEDVVNAKGGLDAMIEQGGRNLSGGQRQRLTIARSLVRRPQILVLDDSASALDQATDKRLRAALQSLDYKPTVFIVSQRTASIKDADKILVLDDGCAVGLGTHEELLENCPIYKEINDSQFKGEVSA